MARGTEITAQPARRSALGIKKNQMIR